jgi:hypothetical protein
MKTQHLVDREDSNQDIGILLTKLTATPKVFASLRCEMSPLS